MDKNQILGIILVSVAVALYINYFAPKKHSQVLDKHEVPKDFFKISSKIEKSDDVGTIGQKNINPRDIILKSIKKSHNFAKNYIISNDKMEIMFNTLGGSIKSVKLLEYRSSSSILNTSGNNINYVTLISPKYLLNKNLSTSKEKINSHKRPFPEETTSMMGIDLDLGGGTIVNTKDLPFQKEDNTNKNIVSFIFKVDESTYIRKRYTLNDNYTINFDLEFKGLGKTLKNNKLIFKWINHCVPQEKDLPKSKEHATINYYTNKNTFASLKIKNEGVSKKIIDTPLKWITIKQRFFSSAILCGKNEQGKEKNLFSDAQICTISDKSDNKILKKAYIKFSLPFNKDSHYKLKFFFGPNKYSVLKNVGESFSSNMVLGWFIIKYINKYFTTPLFQILCKWITNCGLLIIILVLIIKLLLLPLSYKSQIASAKMKVLKPQLDALKKKCGDDKQKAQMAQVNLYKEMGVNPLSGCIPVILQMPILVAMFNFIPNAIEFRQCAFLWAKDLSTYDSIFNLPFSIPLYGDHVSLFAILMTLSIVISTLYNSQMNTNIDPSMKMITYFMPLIFMVVLNSHPAALSFYYFVSNIASSIQQYIIGKFVNEEDIMLKLEQNRDVGKSNGVNIPRMLARLKKKKK